MSKRKKPDMVPGVTRNFTSKVKCTNYELAFAHAHCGHEFDDGIRRCCQCGLPEEPLLQAMVLSQREAT